MCMGGGTLKVRHLVAGLGICSVVFTIPTLIAIGAYFAGKASIASGKKTAEKIRKYLEKSGMVKQATTRREVITQTLQLQAVPDKTLLFERAILDFALDDALHSRQDLNAYLDIDQTSFYAYYLSAMNFQQLCRYDEADAHFAKAIELYDYKPFFDNSTCPTIPNQMYRGEIALDRGLSRLQQAVLQPNNSHEVVMQLLELARKHVDAADGYTASGSWTDGPNLVAFNFAVIDYWKLATQLRKDPASVNPDSFYELKYKLVNNSRIVSAEEYSFAAQALDLAGQQGEADTFRLKAKAIDSKVTIITNKADMLKPWPIYIATRTNQGASVNVNHNFALTRAYLEKCEHCQHHIKTPTGKQAFQCADCNFTCHIRCGPAVTAPCKKK